MFLGNPLEEGVFGAAAEETRVVFFFIFGLNAVRLLAEYSKA